MEFSVVARILSGRNRMIRALTGFTAPEIVAFLNSVNVRRLEIDNRWSALGEWQEGVAAALAESRRLLELESAYMRRQLDDMPAIRQELLGVRARAAWSADLSEVEPLVSVRIASYIKTEELIDVAIASVLRQSYDRFEIIVVNDGPNPTTRKAIEQLRNPRIYYSELPQRGCYPDDKRSRWMVAGSGAANEGARLSRGAWIAPLDDDDEFAVSHIEELLRLAHAQNAELAYGAIEQLNTVNGDENLIWSYPPAINQFSFQGAIYLRRLSAIFEYSTDSWLLTEPADWNLIRRMKEAGVLMAATKEVLTTVHMTPYTHKEH